MMTSVNYFFPGVFANEDILESELKANGVGETFESIISDMKEYYE